MDTVDSQKRFVQMMKIINKQRQYKEVYGQGWQDIYREDKENNTLLPDEF